MSNAIVATELLVKMAVDHASMRADMEKVTQAVGLSGDQISKAMSVAKGALVGLVGAASLGAFKNMILDTIEASSKFNDLAASAGVSASQLQALSKIAGFSGVSAEQMAGAMNKLNMQLVKQGEDGGTAANALKAIGINHKEFIALSPEQRMTAVAKAMANYKDGSEKSAVAMALFGKSGAALVPVMKDLAAAGELQANVTDEQIAMSDDFGDNLTRLQVAGDAWKRELAFGMLPAMNDAVEAFVGVANETGGLRDEMKKLAADGTIDRWTRAAISGFTYLMDAGSFVVRSIKSIGLSLGAVAAQAVSFFGGIGSAFSKFVAGDFSGALDDMNAGVRQARDIEVQANADLKALWSEPTIGQKIRERMAQTAALREEQKRLGNDTEDSKPKINTAGINNDNAEAMKKAKDATEKLAKAGGDWVAQSAQKLASMQKELDLGRPLTEGEELLAKATALVAQKKATFTKEQWAAIEAMAAEMDALSEEKKALKEAAEAQDAYYKEKVKAGEAAQKVADDLNEQVRRQLEENEAIGKTSEQLAQLEIARLKDQARIMAQVVAQEELLGQCTAETEAHKETLAALNKLIEAKEQGIHVKAAKEANDAWAETVKSIGDGLSDSLFRAFESGKGFFKTFWDGVVNTFKTTVLKMAINVIMNPVNAALGSLLGVGNAAASAGGAGGLTGMASLANMFGNLVKGAGSFLNGSMLSNSAMVNTIDLGQWLGSSSNSTIAGLGDKIFSNAGSIGGALGAVGNGFAGYGISKMLSGGYSVGPGNLVNVVSGIASAFFGPVAGVVGGLINRAFGRGPKKVYEQGIVGSIEGGEVTGQTYAAWKQKGGWFRSDKYGTNYAPLSETVDAALDFGAKSVLDQTRALAKTLNLPLETVTKTIRWLGQDLEVTTDALDDVIKNFKVTLTGNAEEDQKVIDKLFEDYQTALSQRFAGAIEPFQKAGESIAQTMERLATLQGFSENINQFGGIFSKLANASISARENVIELAGGIEKLVAAAGRFVADYYTIEEQAGLQAKGALQMFADLGLNADSIKSRDDFRRLVESLDLSTENGQKQLVALLEIAPQFAQLADYLKEQDKTLKDVAAQAPTVAVLNQMLPQQQSTTEAIGTVADQIAAGNATLERIVSAIESGNVSIAAGLAAVAEQQAKLAVLQQRAVMDNGPNTDTMDTRPSYKTDIGGTNFINPLTGFAIP